VSLKQVGLNIKINIFGAHQKSYGLSLDPVISRVLQSLLSLILRGNLSPMSPECDPTPSFSVTSTKTCGTSTTSKEKQGSF